MKRKGFRLLALLLLLMLTLCGCGTAMYELTDEEERIITRYAAYVVAKHNIYQKDGMVSINPDLISPDTRTDETEEETQTSEEDSLQPEEQPDTGNGDITDPVNPPDGAVTFADAVGYDGLLDISYDGYELADNYQEGKVYSLDAHSGYQFVIAKFSARNISGASLDINVLEKNVVFYMSYAKDKKVKEDVTLLLCDLSTYTGTLGIGESADLVLLFEVSEDAIPTMDEPVFSVEKDGENYTIVP